MDKREEKTEQEKYQNYLIVRLGMVCMGQVDREELLNDYRVSEDEPTEANVAA